MQASRVVSSALRATVPARAGFADKSVPNLVKVWKSHVVRLRLLGRRLDSCAGVNGERGRGTRG